jgi:PAS domain S-box-containing protein
MLEHTDQDVTDCMTRAAEAEALAESTHDAKRRAEYQRIAETWRTLARGDEFQSPLGNAISFNESRRNAVQNSLAALTGELTSHNDAEIILRNTPFLLARCSPDLRYVFVSEAFARMLGHTPEELIGKKIVEVIGEKAFEAILPHVNAVLAGQHVEFETEVHYKDISPRFVHVTYTPDKNKLSCLRGWVASITDITERRRAEVALRESDLRMRWLASIVEFSDDARISTVLSPAGIRVLSASSATRRKKQSASPSQSLSQKAGRMRNVKS